MYLWCWQLPFPLEPHVSPLVFYAVRYQWTWIQRSMVFCKPFFSTERISHHLCNEPSIEKVNKTSLILWNTCTSLANMSRVWRVHHCALCSYCCISQIKMMNSTWTLMIWLFLFHKWSVWLQQPSVTRNHLQKSREVHCNKVWLYIHTVGKPRKQRKNVVQEMVNY